MGMYEEIVILLPYPKYNKLLRLNLKTHLSNPSRTPHASPASLHHDLYILIVTWVGLRNTTGRKNPGPSRRSHGKYAV